MVRVVLLVSGSAKGHVEVEGLGAEEDWWWWWPLERTGVWTTEDRGEEEENVSDLSKKMYLTNSRDERIMAMI